MGRLTAAIRAVAGPPTLLNEFAGFALCRVCLCRVCLICGGPTTPTRATRLRSLGVDFFDYAGSVVTRRFRFYLSIGLCTLLPGSSTAWAEDLFQSASRPEAAKRTPRPHAPRQAEPELTPAALPPAVAPTPVAPTPAPGGETLDDLKGLSAEVTTTAFLVYRKPPDNTYFRTYRKELLNVYVSVKGNIFEYQKTPEGMVGKDIVTLDRARNLPSGKNFLYTWTMIDGHLTRIRQYTGGFGIITITIDPVKLSCTVAFRLEAAPNSNDIGDYGAVSGSLMEIHERKLDSYTCNVQRGNIFATDQ